MSITFCTYARTDPCFAPLSGDNQQGDPGTYAPDALMVEVRTPSGELLTNAPVTFAVPQGSGQLAATAELTPPSNVVTSRSGNSGIATAYLTFPPLQNHASSISATAGAGGNVASTFFQFRTNDLPVLPPLALPSPTPSPDPSVTPPAPLHYALIDLGKNVQPMRLGNNGWVLARYQPEAGSPFGRWKAGVIEQLSYNDPSVEWEPTDMNSAGTVVGRLYPPFDLSSGQDTEVAAGVVWQPDNPIATTKISAPLIATTPPSDQPVRPRGARLDAINDAGNLFGGVYTGWGYGTSLLGFPNPVVNAYRWSANGTGPQALSRGTATNIGFVPPFFQIARLNGPVSSVMRANSSGHYIGGMLVPGIDPTFPTGAGMVDGRSVSYHPWDINESGMVVGFSEDFSGMVVINADGSRRDIAGANPYAINAFVRHEIDSQGQAKETAAPQIAGLWFEGYVRGWVPAVWEYAPNGEWVPHALQDLIGASRGWNLFDLADINDQGIIVGVADYKDPANPQAQGESHGFMLVPVEVVELAPKLGDDEGNEIRGSETPKPLPQTNAMVERDPATNQEDAAAIRIAWRELKVKIGSALKDKKVTWSMEPLSTPSFRGSWEHAVASHADRFEASTAFTAHSYRRVSQEQGETTIDADGFTAIRVNVPPIGLNKARIKIEFEGSSAPLKLIDLEVPGVIVIDPGHGIGAAGGSNAVGASGVSTGTEEHAFALDIAQRMAAHLRSRRDAENLQLKVLLTRTGTTNISFPERTKVARENGCDVYVSIHFNALVQCNIEIGHGMS